MSGEEMTATERWVYAGQVEDAGGKMLHKWWRIDGDGLLETQPPVDESSEQALPTYYGKARNLAPGRPGVVYRLQIRYQDGHPVAVVGKGAYLGLWPHDDQVTAWQLRHDSARTAARQRKLVAREQRRVLWRERLDPVRELYQDTPSRDRAAVLAMIVEYLTRPYG